MAGCTGRRRKQMSKWEHESTFQSKFRCERWVVSLLCVLVAHYMYVSS